MDDEVTDSQIDLNVGQNKWRFNPFVGLAKLVRFTITAAVVVAMIAAGFLIGGFLKFTDTVSSAKVSKPIQAGDAIVVYTGGAARIKEALKLLEAGRGKRLLISGVNPAISRESLLKQNSIKASLYDCCVDIDKKAADTVGNAEEAKKWAESHDYKSLVIVTSNYHMPRSLLETRRLLPDATLIPYPVLTDDFDSSKWYKDRMTLRLLLSEYSKYVAAQVRTFAADQGFQTISARMIGN